MTSRPSLFTIVNSTIVVTGMLFLIAPLAMVVSNSVGPELLATFPPQRLSLVAYASIPGKWLVAFRNSVFLAVGTALLSSILGTFAALALSRGHLRGRELLDAVLKTPLQVPALVMSVAFLQYFSWIASTAGLQFRDTFAGLLLVHTSVAIPYVSTVVLARLASFDATLEDAAFGLGASTLQTMFRVTLPLIAPAIFSGGFFAFLLSLDNVPLSIFLVGGSLTLLPVELFSAIQFDLTRTVYALATVVCIFTTIIVVFVYKWLTSVVAIVRM